MSDFQGMTTTDVTDFASHVTEDAHSLSALLDTLSQQIDSIVSSGWSGPDADSFAQDFHGRTRPQFTVALDALRARGADLEMHVKEQDTASTPTAVGNGNAAGAALSASFGAVPSGMPTFGPGIASGPGPSTSTAAFLGADWEDISFGEVWENWKENVGIDGTDSSGGILSTSHSFVKNFGDLVSSASSRVRR